MDKNLKYLKEHYICTVNPFKRKVWDFKKKKQVKLMSFNRASKKLGPRPNNFFPIGGYVCPGCDCWSTHAKHYLVGDESLCEKCALIKVNKLRECNGTNNRNNK